MSMENSTLYENSYSAYTQSAKKSTSEVRAAEKLQNAGSGRNGCFYKGVLCRFKKDNKS